MSSPIRSISARSASSKSVDRQAPCDFSTGSPNCTTCASAALAARQRPRDRAAARRPRRRRRRPRGRSLSCGSCSMLGQSSARRVYCGSTSTLNATPRCARGGAGASTAAPIGGDGARAVVRLDDDLAAVRGRAGGTAAPGPSTLARPPAAPRRAAAALGRGRVRRRVLGGRAARCGSASRTAGSAAPRGARARRRGSPAASWRAARDDRRARRARASGRAPARRRRRGRAPGELGDEREGALLGAEVREAQRRVGVDDDARASTSGKSWPLATICVPTQDRRGRRRSNAREDRGRAARRPASASRRKTGAGAAARSRSSRSVPGAVAGDRHRAAVRAALAAPARGGRSGGRRASRRARCSDERDVAVRALPRAPAGAAGQEVRPAAAVEQHDRLAPASTQRLVRVAGAAAPRDAAQVERSRPAGIGAPSTRRGQRRCAAALATISGRGVALPATSTAPWSARAALGDVPRVVARVALVLVGGVVLLVDDDQAEVARSARRPPSAGRRRPAPRRARSRSHSS